MRVRTSEDEDPIEVSADQVEVEDDDPFLTQDEVDDIVSKRVSRARRTAREELKSDDDFFEEAASKRGIELRDDGQPKGSIADDELKELKQKASKVESLEEEVSKYEREMESIRKTKLENQILQQAEGFASEQAQRTAIREVASQMAYDEEYGWHEVAEGGEPVYEAGEPRGVAEVVSGLEDSHEFLFERSRNESGSGFGADDGGGAGRKAKSDYSRSERADFYQRMRSEGKDPNEEWEKLPDE